MTSTLP